MYAVEFRTKIRNGMIIIPEEYRKQITRRVKVILLSEADANTHPDFIDELLASPIKLSDFSPLKREEIYNRVG